MSEEEIRAVCEKNGHSKTDIDRRVDTNNRIAEEIVTEIDLHQTLFPNYDSPEDIVELYEKNKDILVED